MTDVLKVKKWRQLPAEAQLALKSPHLYPDRIASVGGVCACCGANEVTYLTQYRDGLVGWRVFVEIVLCLAGAIGIGVSIWWGCMRLHSRGWIMTRRVCAACGKDEMDRITLAAYKKTLKSTDKPVSERL